MLLLLLFATLTATVYADWKLINPAGGPIYNTENNALLSGRRNPSSWLHKNNLYVFGGRGEDERLNDLWKYETSLKRWFWQPETPLQGRSGSSQWSSNGIFWLYGGRNDSKNNHGLEDFWSYNPDTREWKEHTISPNPGIRYGSYFWQDDSNNFLYLFGGKSDTNTILEDAWRFNTKDETWESVELSGEEFSLKDDGVAVKISDYVYFFEGKEFLRLDLSSLTVKTVSSSGDYPEKREDFVMWPHGNKIHLFGGRVNSQFYNDFWTFDTDEEVWFKNSENSGNLPEARWGSAFWANDGDLFMFGGKTEDSSSPTNDLWLYSVKNSTDVTDNTNDVHVERYNDSVYPIAITNLAFTTFLVFTVLIGFIFFILKKRPNEVLKKEELPSRSHDFDAPVVTL